MLDLAISEDVTAKGETVVLTNHGRTLHALDWPQDCDFQLVGFSPSAIGCNVVWTEQLAHDIGMAIEALDGARAVGDAKPDWYRRLVLYAERGGETA